MAIRDPTRLGWSPVAISHHNTDRYMDYLRRRWNEGCHNALVLFGELVEQGFQGSVPSVRRTVAAWRKTPESTREGEMKPHAPRSALGKRPSSRRVSWLLFLPAEELDADDKKFIEAIRRHAPPLSIAGELAQQFREIVKTQRAGSLSDWITRACGSSVPSDIRRFALGLLADQPTIEASILLPWSNGQVEGQVNRLKVVKRESYGRASLDLKQAYPPCAK
jgi:transposase